MAMRAVPAARTNIALTLARALLGPDPPLTPELEDIVRQALTLLKQYKRNLYSLGAVYASLVGRKLAEKAKFHGAQDFWIRNVPVNDVSVRSVQMWSRIASTWNPEFVKYAATCHDLLIRYCANRRLSLRKDVDPGPMPITFADKSGKDTQKPFSQCSYRDMVLAVYGSTQAPQLPEQEQEIFDEVDKIIMSATVGDHRTRLTGKMEDLELIFDLTASRSLLPFIVEALHEWALERTGAMPAPSDETERKSKPKKSSRKRR